MMFNAFRQKLKGEKDHKYLSHLNTTRPVRSLISSCKFTMICLLVQRVKAVNSYEIKKKTNVYFLHTWSFVGSCFEFTSKTRFSRSCDIFIWFQNCLVKFDNDNFLYLVQLGWYPRSGGVSVSTKGRLPKIHRIMVFINKRFCQKIYHCCLQLSVLRT